MEQNPVISRRTVLGAFGVLGASALVGACSSSAKSSPRSSSASSATGAASAAPTTSSASATAPAQLTDLSFAMAFLPNVEYGGNFIADDQGYYREQGLAVKIMPGGPSAPAPEVSLSSGSATIVTEANTVRLFNYWSQHDDIVLIGQIYQKSPNGLLSLAKKPVRGSADLKGIRLLAASSNRPNMNALMKVNGLTPNDYTFVPAGADVGPLLAGQGDALLAFSNNQPITLQQQHHMTEGKDYFFAFFSDLSYPLISDAFLVKRSYLDAHRDDVVKFMRATAKGYQTMLKQPELAAQLAVDKYGKSLALSLPQQQAVAAAEVPLIEDGLSGSRGVLSVNTDLIQNKVFPAMSASGVSKLPDLSKVVDTTIMAEVYKNGTTL